MDRLLMMQSFAMVVETRSFSAAARELGTGQPNVSRNISALERHLGRRLLHRSTRRLSLTPEGERYYVEVRRVLDALAEAESNARGTDEPSGMLKVTCPTSLGNRFVMPRVKQLLERFPKLDVDLQVSDKLVNLVQENVDLAIRAGPPRAESMSAQRIGTSERVCVASAAYLTKHPAPATPLDLAQHDCIVSKLLAPLGAWTFRDSQVIVSGRLKVDTTEGIKGAVLDGVGIGYGPIWLFEDEVRRGEILVLLVDQPVSSTPINILFPSGRPVPGRAREFIDFIATEFASISSLNEGAVQRLLSEIRA